MKMLSKVSVRWLKSLLEATGVQRFACFPPTCWPFLLVGKSFGINWSLGYFSPEVLREIWALIELLSAHSSWLTFLPGPLSLLLSLSPFLFPAHPSLPVSPPHILPGTPRMQLCVSSASIRPCWRWPLFYSTNAVCQMHTVSPIAVYWMHRHRVHLPGKSLASLTFSYPLPNPPLLLFFLLFT